nr:MAG TPA: hypothetical protein [Caudoviricetes sp.]
MLPSEELLQSIDIIAQNAAKNGVKIYTAIVTAVGDNNTCSIRANGKTHSNIAYYGEKPSVNKSYRVFCPNGSMNQAFIITGGGVLPIASADVLGGIKVGAGLSISEQGTLSTTGGGTADAVEWKNVLDKPTTIAGYGITDAKIDGNNVVLGNQTMTPYSANNPPAYPVTSVNGQTGNVVIPTGGNVDSVNGKTGVVVLSAADVGALPNTTVIPDKTSQLDNDSGYITNSALTDYAKKTEIPTKTSELTNDSGYITNTALEPYAKTADVPTKTSQLDNDSHYITANEAPVQSVNTKTGAVVLTQDDVGDGKTYVRTHNDLTDVLKTQINTNEDNIAMLDGDIEGLQTDVGTLKTNVTSLQTALTSKQDVIVGAASTITEDNLATDRALISNSSGKVAVSNVTSTELGYLDGVTSNIQTQLNKKLEKAPVTSVNSKTGAVQLNASDVGALPDTTIIPSKTSQLDNDSGFITDVPIASATQLGGVKVGAGLSVTANGVLSATGGGTADAVEWNNVLDKPTTIVGYGITDAKIENGTITLGNQTITPLISAPVTSVNSKTGAVVLGASDVGAISTGNISQTLGVSTTKVPSEKAVSDALSSAGAGDMLKSTYDPTGSVATAGGIPDYVEANGGKIDTIKVNGTAQTITNKAVDITVPTKTSDLTNDSGYLTSAPVTSVNSKTGAVVLTANDVGALPADTVIPTVNNATLTIRRNSVDVGSFTANSANDVNIDINVPTDKSDIGLGNVDNVKQYSASNPPPYPVTSVNGKTGDVTIDVSGGGTQVKIVRW